jgi:ribosomal protein L27
MDSPVKRLEGGETGEQNVRRLGVKKYENKIMIQENVVMEKGGD